MIYQYQPVDPTQAFASGYNFVQGIKQNQAQQQAQVRRQNALQEALASVQTDPNPQNIANFYLRFPEMKEQFDAYREALAEGDKTSLEGAAQEAIIAQQTGGDPSSIYARYAEAAENSRRPELAQQFRDAQRIAETSPEAADLTARMFYQQLNPDGYEAIFGSDSSTGFQKDYAFIREEFGEDAASEFAQFGRGGVVSIPLPGGQTYIGPPSMAPGATRWQQGAQTSGGAQPDAQNGADILEGASKRGAITQAEARVIQDSLGPRGRAAFDDWRAKNKIRIITRSGTDANGRRVVQYDDGTIEYAAD